MVAALLPIDPLRRPVKGQDDMLAHAVHMIVQRAMNSARGQQRIAAQQLLPYRGRPVEDTGHFLCGLAFMAWLACPIFGATAIIRVGRHTTIFRRSIVRASFAAALEQ